MHIHVVGIRKIEIPVGLILIVKADQFRPFAAHRDQYGGWRFGSADSSSGSAGYRGAGERPVCSAVARCAGEDGGEILASSMKYLKVLSKT